MTHTLRIKRSQGASRHAGIIAVALASTVAMSWPPAAVNGAPWLEAPASQAAPADAEAAALQEFQRRLNGYIKLRADLAKKLKPLSPTADTSELTARQEALAAAIKTARKDARPGDLIPAPVADRIRTIVTADIRNRNQQARQGTFEEVPNGIVIGINRTYPARAALPTVPPLLLGKLPVLPDNLQYRFVDRYVVILDGDTQIVIDYVRNALPPH